MLFGLILVSGPLVKFAIDCAWGRVVINQVNVGVIFLVDVRTRLVIQGDDVSVDNLKLKAVRFR